MRIFMKIRALCHSLLQTRVPDVGAPLVGARKRAGTRPAPTKWPSVTTILLGALGGAWLLCASPAAAAPSSSAGDVFTAKGTVTRVETEEETAGKIFHIKIDGGLELTFHAGENTAVSAGGRPGGPNDVSAGEAVEIEYAYDEDFKKVLRALKRPGGSS